MPFGRAAAPLARHAAVDGWLGLLERVGLCDSSIKLSGSPAGVFLPVCTAQQGRFCNCICTDLGKLQRNAQCRPSERLCWQSKELQVGIKGGGCSCLAFGFLSQGYRKMDRLGACQPKEQISPLHVHNPSTFVPRTCKCESTAPLHAPCGQTVALLSLVLSPHILCIDPAGMTGATYITFLAGECM